MSLYCIIWYCMVLHEITWYCIVLHCWLWCAGCISQDTYLRYNIQPIFTDEGKEAEEAFRKELIATIDFVIEDLKKDNIDIDSVVILVDGGELLEDIKKFAPPSWPEAVHVQSFMGYEAPVVIWLTSGDYLDRQVGKPNPNLTPQKKTYFDSHVFSRWRQQVEQ